MDWRRSGTSSALTQFIQHAQQLLPALGRTTGVAAAGCLAREPFRFRGFPLLSQTNLALAVSSGRVVGKRYLGLLQDYRHPPAMNHTAACEQGLIGSRFHRWESSESPNRCGPFARYPAAVRCAALPGRVRTGWEQLHKILECWICSTC